MSAGQDYPLTNAATDAEFRRRTHDWALRLARVCKLGAPKIVISHSILCIIRKAMAYDPDGFSSFIVEMFKRHARIAAGLCTNCTNQAGESGLYERCDHEMEKLLDSDTYKGEVP